TPVHSLILTPLRVRGRNLGVLVIANKEGDEVFDSRDTMLLHALAEQAALTVDLVRLSDLLTKQQKLEQELQIAREFQGMLLPQSLPNIEGYEFGALNESALMVGGDFYDFIPVDRNHLGIVIADVSGKGIPGALIMAVVRSHLRAEARDTLSPKEVLRRVNERILSETKENVFVTITYAILDIPNQRIRLVRAGHEPILVRHEKPSARVEAILPEGMAVGLMPTEVFQSTEEVESQLEEGDTVFLYTDGAIEAVNAADEEFGRERLIEFLSGPAGRSAPEWIAGLAGEIRNFSRGIPQHDDITLLAFRVKPEAAAEAEQASTAG
ncbi:PP2C family protein-serine/threonine phosphatase, partial [Candidatus Sumerlaeota bacterium]|nr:PP2C family protein-serine/threonine phosphatase [Candidatus Sumerlaeota bacterium]